MKHFLEINQLSAEQIQALLERALYFKRQCNHPSYPHSKVAQLFYENSTRTRVSFELAAKALSMQVVNLDLDTSSQNKGETIEDTLQNLAAMGITHFVIRHKENDIPMRLASLLDGNCHLINAGSGTLSHPSQALLDMMTIIEQKPQLDSLKIAVVGNIKHSRVASSFQVMCAKLGIGELVLIAPQIWQPTALHYGQVTNDLAAGLKDADVVMCLRVQTERLLETEHLDLQDYKQNFSLTQKSLAYAKPQVMVMHPGPINRGVEITSEVADGPQSFILQQVTNGVYARMAIFDAMKFPNRSG